MSLFSRDDPLFAVTSLANLAAGYNLAIAGHVLFLIESSGEGVDETQTSLVASAAFVGAVLGQLTFGYVGERLGTTFGLVVTFLILCIGCLLGAFAVWPDNLLAKLAISRLIVGFGAGGVYPLAAVASAESSQGGEFNGQRVMLSFSFQGLGQLLAPAWVLVLDLLLPYARGLSWRVAILSGSIPAGFAIGYIPDVLSLQSGRETSRREDVVADEVFARRWSKENLVRLIGTGGSWFLFDVMFYGNIIFTPFVLKLVFDAKETEVAFLSTLIGLVALPGLYLASLLSDSWGRKKIQLVGFSCCGVLFLILFLLIQFTSSLRVVTFMMYCLTFFFYNFGPNATTFCLPAETFPHHVRSFFNGISAACGKLGAVVGASFFKYVLDKTSLSFVMLCSVALSLVAIAVTWLFVNPSFSSGVTRLEPIPDEDAAGHSEIELGSLQMHLDRRKESDHESDQEADSNTQIAMI